MKILAALYLATLFLLVFLGTTGLSLPSHTGSWKSERDYFTSCGVS